MPDEGYSTDTRRKERDRYGIATHTRTHSWLSHGGTAGRGPVKPETRRPGGTGMNANRYFVQPVSLPKLRLYEFEERGTPSVTFHAAIVEFTVDR